MRSEDGSIIYECLSGDPEAFGILVDKYKASIYAYVYNKIRSFQDAEDVTQEVFLQAYRSLRSLRHWESFAFWLHRIARNLCNKWLRTSARRPDGAFMEDQDPEVLEKPALDGYREHQTRNSLHESLQEALDSLSETYREVLTLYYFGGMTVKDMARAIGVSPTAIRKRMSRARARLKEEMIAMMDTAFEGQRLQASFTFRIVEAIKHIKVHPMPRMAGLPWGLSLAAGIIITVLSLNPHLSTPSDIAIPSGSPLPVESMVLKAGEIPVDILRTDEISVISSKQGDGNSGTPKLPELHTALMADHGEGDEWTQKADMPTARAWYATSVVNGKVYAIGGIVGLGMGTATSAVEEYDPATDAWMTKADMPTARDSLSTCVVDGRIYAIGGYNDLNNNLSIVEEYDPVTDKWTKKANMPTARWGLSTSVVGRRIYAIGGGSPGKIHSELVEEYDPVTDKWTKKADMLTGRTFPSTSMVNGKIYAIGGSNRKNATLDYSGVSTVEEYDPVEDEWTKKSDMPTARWALSTSTVNDRIYAIGGGDRQVPFKVVEVYDPKTDTWGKRDDMPTARGGASTSVVDGKIYIIGGINIKQQFLSTVEEYTPPGSPFSVSPFSPQGKLPTKWGEVKSE